MTPHLHAIITELNREKEVRRSYYPKKVAEQPEKREQLARQFERLVAARQYLEGKTGLDISVADALKELRRELKMREEFYPKWVAARRISPEDSMRWLALWRQAIDELTALLPPPKTAAPAAQTSLFA